MVCYVLDVSRRLWQEFQVIAEQDILLFTFDVLVLVKIIKFILKPPNPGNPMKNIENPANVLYNGKGTFQIF